jgi:hypothetical protein
MYQVGNYITIDVNHPNNLCGKENCTHFVPEMRRFAEENPVRRIIRENVNENGKTCYKLEGIEAWNFTECMFLETPPPENIKKLEKLFL